MNSRKKEWGYSASLPTYADVQAANAPFECPIAAKMLHDIERDAPAMSHDALLAAAQARIAHMDDCPVCRAREGYLHRHAPPLPDPPVEAPSTSGRFGRLLGRLSRSFRLPEGEPGDARRAALRWAVVIAITAVAYAETTQHRRQAPITGLQLLRLGSFLFLTFVVGLFLAGWVIDATRAWKDRFLGYVFRGACGASVIYAAGAAFAPIMGTRVTLHDTIYWLIAVFSGGGAVGTIMWLLDWIKGRDGNQASGR